MNRGEVLGWLVVGLAILAAAILLTWTLPAGSLELLRLTGPDGQVVEINPAEIVAIREPRRSEHFAPGTHCLIFTTDNKYLSVSETCDQFDAKLKALPK